jgi:Domain of unknown function (DUF4037)
MFRRAYALVNMMQVAAASPAGTYTCAMSKAVDFARDVANRYSRLSAVHAIALGGSQSSAWADKSSDIDLYVYVTHALSLEQRADVTGCANRREIGNAFWEPGDEWVDEASGVAADVMFREMSWMDEQVARVMHDHRASLGYSTCFVFNVKTSTILFDREGWLAELQQKASAPYPEELKRNIVAKNHPILRNNISSYTHQIEKAISRNDAVSVNHRVTALLASYFDVLFAVNEQMHPGEKRLLRKAQLLCTKLPEGIGEQLEQVLASVSQHDERLLASIHKLLDSLDALLKGEQLIA